MKTRLSTQKKTVASLKKKYTAKKQMLQAQREAERGRTCLISTDLRKQFDKLDELSAEIEWMEAKVGREGKFFSVGFAFILIGQNSPPFFIIFPIQTFYIERRKRRASEAVDEVKEEVEVEGGRGNTDEV